MNTVNKTRLDVIKRPDGSDVFLPVIEVRGREGPNLKIGSSIHGDEITPHVSIWKLMEYLRQKDIKGTVTIAPVLNPECFSINSRGFPLVDFCLGIGGDPNRTFPGDPKGGPAEILYSRIFEFAKKSDVYVDFHSGGFCLPFILLDPAEGDLRNRIEELAYSTGISTFNELRPERWAEYQAEARRIAGSLTGALVMEAKIPSFTIELSGYKTIDMPSAEVGFVGIKNLMIKMGMVDDKPQEVPNAIKEKGLTYVELRCKRGGGVMQYFISPGHKVGKNDKIARIRDFYGEVVEEVNSPYDGYAFLLNATHIARTGSIVAGMGVKL